MLPKFTTYLLLTAITIQGVFGGLQDSVSICLGGGHEHEVEEVVESAGDSVLVIEAITAGELFDELLDSTADGWQRGAGGWVVPNR